MPTSAILGVLSGVDWLAKHTVTGAGSAHFLDLRECDRRAGEVQTFHIGLAVAEGGAAGFFGLAAMAVDIPALLTLALRMIRQVGIEYGYAEDNEAERQFCFSMMQSASANTVEEKLAAQFVLAELGNMIAKQTWKAMAEKAAGNLLSKEAAMTALRALAKQVGVTLTKRKALEAIPVMGAVVGAASNAWFLREVGVTAEMAYRERWLLEHATEELSEMALEALG